MQDDRQNKRKTREGVVISNKMDKTVVVQVTRTMRHPKYSKVIELKRKYYAHDESDQIEIGQRVRIVETRPLSKMKRWRVAEAL